MNRSEVRRFNKRMRELGVPARLCRECTAIKHHNRFNVDRRSPDGRMSICRTCDSARKLAYARSHREQERLRAAAWYRDNHDRARKRNREYGAKNAEAARKRARDWYRDNSDRAKEYQRTYSEQNPDKIRAIASRRRARKAAATVENFTAEDMYDAWEAQGLYACIVCDGPFEHIDHWVPLALGGAHAAENLVPMCASCNIRKGAKHPVEFLEQEVPGILAWLDEFNSRPDKGDACTGTP